MEVKDDSLKNIVGGLWQLAKVSSRSGTYDGCALREPRKSQMTFIAIKTFTRGPLWHKTGNQLPAFGDIREERDSKVLKRQKDITRNKGFGLVYWH